MIPALNPVGVFDHTKGVHQKDNEGDVLHQSHRDAASTESVSNKGTAELVKLVGRATTY